MLAFLGRLVSRHPWWVVGAVLVVTGACVPFLFNLRAEADLIRLLPENDPAIKTLEIVDTEFGGSEQVAVVIETDDIFASQTLHALDSLVRRIEKLAGVNKVEGLTTLQDVKGIGDDIVISRIIDSIPGDPTRMQQLREQVLADKRYRGVLVDTGGKTALFLVRLVPGSNKAKTVAEIEKLANWSRLAGRVSLTGSAALTKYIRDWMVADLILLLPLVVLVLVGVLLVGFRSWRGLLPLFSVLISLVWTMGLVGMLGQPVTIVLIVLPPVLVSVGSAYGIHVVGRWEQEFNKGTAGRSEAVRLTVKKTGLPVLLAMATTAVGFGANLVMRVPSIRWFGFFSAVGVFFAFVLSVTLVPAVLHLISRGPEAGNKHGLIRGWNKPASRFWTWWAKAVSGRRWLILGVVSALAVAAALFIPRVHPETDFVQYFKSNSSPARASRVIAEQFGGQLQFEILVEGDIQDPKLLARIEKFEQELTQVRYLTHTFSLADVLRATNKAFNNGKQEFDRIPGTREEIAQYLLLLSFSGSEFLADYVTSDYQLARITARFNKQESREIGLATRRIRELIDEHFSQDTKVTLGGMPMATYSLHQDIQTSQLATLVLALVAVFLLVSLVFRSVRLGAVALVPVGLAVVLNFGIMGLLGIQVDMVTAMLGAIAVGIGIDYSCHLIARWREEQGNGGTRLTQLARTLESVGPPILTNAVSVGLGFAVLTFSSLVIIQKFGILITEMTVLAGLGALVVLPALLSARLGKRRNQ